MANRNTKTEKWRDAWFLDLDSNSKLLFIYLTENCDIAGFIEISYKIWSFETGLKIDDLKTSLELISEKINYSADYKYLFIPKFIVHQNNYPLNLENNAHKAIYKKLEYFSQMFDLHDFIKNALGGSKGLISPPVMSCNSNSNNNVNNNVKIKNENKIPEKSELVQFFVENGYRRDYAENVWEYYQNLNWFDSKGNIVKSWKAKCRAVWFKNEGKIKESNEISKYKYK